MDEDFMTVNKARELNKAYRDKLVKEFKYAELATINYIDTQIRNATRDGHRQVALDIENIQVSHGMQNSNTQGPTSFQYMLNRYREGILAHYASLGFDLGKALTNSKGDIPLVLTW